MMDKLNAIAGMVQDLLNGGAGKKPAKKAAPADPNEDADPDQQNLDGDDAPSSAKKVQNSFRKATGSMKEPV